MFTQSIEQDERRGLSRKAAADRKRKERIEGSREEVRQLSVDIEAELTSQRRFRRFLIGPYHSHPPLRLCRLRDNQAAFSFAARPAFLIFQWAKR